MNFLHRTWAEIDISALIHNFNLIKNISKNSKIMSVVKANAYGHSVENIAPVLEKVGTDWFAVSNIDEAVQLRNIGISKPILILGYTPFNLTETLSKYNISQCVYSYDYAKKLSEDAVLKNVTLKIHLKLDTGMSRLGYNCKNDSLSGINEAADSGKLPNIYTEGVFTHFLESDRNLDLDDGFTNKQFSLFKKAVEQLKNKGITPEICHCCNSAALVLDEDKHLDLCRPGIILYGLNPSDAPQLEIGLKPVMTLKSVVSMVKDIEKGDVVSYGKTFTADKKIRVATVAVGYADGYPRLLSNQGYVLINGQKAKILGRVCMDQITVDITNIGKVKMGDEVILFGKDLSVDEIAKLSGTINYEIVCGISPRVPKIVINN